MLPIVSPQKLVVHDSHVAVTTGYHDDRYQYWYEHI